MLRLQLTHLGTSREFRHRNLQQKHKQLEEGGHTSRHRGDHVGTATDTERQAGWLTSTTDTTPPYLPCGRVALAGLSPINRASKTPEGNYLWQVIDS